MAALTRVAVLAALAAVATVSAQERPQERQGLDQESFRFRSGVELINVTATVSDGQRPLRLRSRQEDFRVYEDGEPRPITQFTAERVPVSLGIVLDTSGSMAGEKMQAAKQALKRFLFDLLGDEDEVFLYRFDNRPELVSPWTRSKDQVGRRTAADSAARRHHAV